MRHLLSLFMTVFCCHLSMANSPSPSPFNYDDEDAFYEDNDDEDYDYDYDDLDPIAGRDPFEGVNRFIYGFNHGLDTMFFRPAAELYSFVPSPARKGARNFITNLSSPVTFLNDIFQLNGMRAGQTLVRTLINTTLGLGGLFDVATSMGLEYHSEDFGQTMAVYGISSGPYLVLPVLGPYTPRSLVGRGADLLMNPLNWVWENNDFGWFGFTVYGVDLLDRRTEARAFIDELNQSIDPYAKVRSLYFQSIDYQVHDEEYDYVQDEPRPISEEYNDE